MLELTRRTQGGLTSRVLIHGPWMIVELVGVQGCEIHGASGKIVVEETFDEIRGAVWDGMMGPG